MGEHLRLDFDAINDALRADRLGHAPTEITRAAAEVRHRITRFERERLHQEVGPLLLIPLRPVQPRRAEMRHVVGNFPPEIILTDAIQRPAARLVAVGWLRPIRRCVLRYTGASRERDAHANEESRNETGEVKRAVHARTFRAAKFLGKGNRLLLRAPALFLPRGQTET